MTDRRLEIRLPDRSYCALYEMAEATKGSMGEFARAAIETCVNDPEWREREMKRFEAAGMRKR